MRPSNTTLTGFGLTLGLAATLGGCTLAPATRLPPPPVADSWSVETPVSSEAAPDRKSVLVDTRLASTVELAIANNRDLRVAALNIERARATHQSALSSLLPALNLSASRSQSKTSAATSSSGVSGYSDIDTANVVLSAWEIDLFGRLRSLSRAASENALAAANTHRAVEINLVSSVAQAWLSVAADADLLRLSESTLKARTEALEIGQKRHEIGSLSEVDLNTLKGLAATARADTAAARTRYDADLSSLTLLVGAGLPADLIPAGLGDVNVAYLSDVPVGLPSEVLLRRPDIASAEHSLRAQNANIGAARAAFLPRLSLTGQAGAASPEFETLFDKGTHTYSFTPSLSLPLFSGGANFANLKTARVNRDIAVAQYEKAIQSAFNEVNQGLSVKARIEERYEAQTEAAGAASRNLELVRARYAQGVDGYLALLDAERNAYTAQSALISLRLLKESNKAALYKAIGTQ